MELKLEAVEGTILGYKTTKTPDLDIAVKVQLEGKQVWSAFEKLCPGIEKMAKMVAGEETVGAQHIHCHTTIDNINLTFATRESDDLNVEPVVQLALEDCKVGSSTKSCIVMLDDEGNGAVVFHVVKRLPKKDHKTLAELRGADLVITTQVTQPPLPLSNGTSTEASA